MTNKTKDMVEYATIRAPREAVEKAKQAKRESEEWGDYLKRCADSEPTVEIAESDIERMIDERINKRVVETARL